MRMEKGLHVARWVPRGWGLGLTKKMKPKEGKAWGRDGELGPAPTWIQQLPQHTENPSTATPQLHPNPASRRQVPCCAAPNPQVKSPVFTGPCTEPAGVERGAFLSPVPAVEEAMHRPPQPWPQPVPASDPTMPQTFPHPHSALSRLRDPQKGGRRARRLTVLTAPSPCALAQESTDWYSDGPPGRRIHLHPPPAKFCSPDPAQALTQGGSDPSGRRAHLHRPQLSSARKAQELGLLAAFRLRGLGLIADFWVPGASAFERGSHCSQERKREGSELWSRLGGKCRAGTAGAVTAPMSPSVPPAPGSAWRAGPDQGALNPVPSRRVHQAKQPRGRLVSGSLVPRAPGTLPASPPPVPHTPRRYPPTCCTEAPTFHPPLVR